MRLCAPQIDSVVACTQGGGPGSTLTIKKPLKCCSYSPNRISADIPRVADGTGVAEEHLINLHIPRI